MTETTKRFDIHFYRSTDMRWAYAGSESATSAHAAKLAFRRDPGNRVYEHYKIRARRARQVA